MPPPVLPPGLPGELLTDTPRGIYDAMMLYSSTLRDGYDDATNGELVRATMAAYLPGDHAEYTTDPTKYRASTHRARQPSLAPHPTAA